MILERGGWSDEIVMASVKRFYFDWIDVQKSAINKTSKSLQSEKGFRCNAPISKITAEKAMKSLTCLSFSNDASTNKIVRRCGKQGGK